MIRPGGLVNVRPGLAVLVVLVVGIPAVPAKEGAGRLHGRIAEAVEAATAEILELRHRIHEHPELGNREEATAALVTKHLHGLGIDRIDTGVAHTGVVAVLEGGKPGPVVAVRADMDALPVKEETNFPFASTMTATWEGREVPVAHACGHDVHTAVGLGVASVLASFREDLPGTVKFIFQPAEEGPPKGEKGGAELMIERGVLAEPRPEAIFALHAYPDLEVGELAYTPGPAMAAVDHFRVTIRGRQAHGARPHEGRDPLVMAAEAVSAFQTIPSRTIDPLEPVVVTVGRIQGGERFNIIPSEVRLEGTVRTYGDEVRDTVERRMREILGGITAAHGGSWELDYERLTPATVNDVTLTKAAVPTLESVVGEENVRQVEPTMGGEDFAYFAREIPGFYFRLGTTKPDTGSGGLHTPTFRADDDAVPVGMRVMSTLVVDYLTRGLSGRHPD